ncbi:MAG: hypothetical protein K0Q76_1425 [Panacagrimonas sp.]|nr:hypothetical protein [Panacagrimonas sp.]
MSAGGLMKITPKTIEYAIHRVLVSRQVCVGCGMPLRELIQIWPETMLRRGDLIAGLERLRASRHLAIEQAADGPRVTLLDESFSLVSTADDRAAVTALNTLREARKRPAAHLKTLLPSEVFARRTSDAIATA